MSLFEALYGRKCRSPLCWVEVGDSHIIGPEMVHKTTETIAQICNRMAAARDLPFEKLCDRQRKRLEFNLATGYY